MAGALDEAIATVEERLRAEDAGAALRAARELRDAESPVRLVWADLLEAQALALDERELRGARALADRAVSRARQLDDRRIEAAALRALARVLLVAGELAAADRALRDGEARIRGTADRVRLAEILADRGRVLARSGALDEAETLVAEAVRAFDTHGERRLAVEALVLGARIRRQAGDPAGAREVLAAAERRFQALQAGDEPLAVQLWAAQAELALAEGDGHEALRLARRALGRLGPGRALRRGELWALVAEAHRRLDDPDAAAAAFRRCAEILDEAGHDDRRPRANEVVELVRRGRYDEARARLAPLLDRQEHEGGGLAVLHALALPCAVHARDWSAWAHHWRRATSLAGERGAVELAAADAARRAGEMCAAIPDGGAALLSRAVRAHALALALYRALDRGDDAVAQARTLHELGGRGAPIPAGPFDLTRRIGRGAMGEVWRGRHHERRLVVAVKVVAPGQVGDARFRRLIESEIRAVAALDHPNVVRVLGAGLLGPEAEAVAHGEVRVESPWFAMQLADAGTLDALCGRLPWSGVRTVLLSLLDALAHAHARGVVHLDLKPANVLLRRLPDGSRGVLLTDFGLAHVLARAGVRASVAGTPQYMAPEQFAGDPREYGPWTDLYALGCLAVHLVNGAPPFGGPTLEAQREAHLSARPPALRPRTPMPLALEGWIRRLLEKAPADRWQRAADAAWALRRMPDTTEELPPWDPADALGSVGGSAFVLSVDTEADAPVELPASSAAGGRLGDRPPLPEDWRPVGPARGDLDFADAALSLFGLRRPPLVGRDAERDRLWAVLREVSFRGAPRVVLLGGARGSGKTALARWLCERAHELGAATVLDGGAGADGQRGLEALVARHLRLDGLSPEQAEARVRAVLPELDPEIAADLAVLVAERGVALTPGERVGAVAALAQALAAVRPVIVRLEPDATEPDVPHLARVLLAVPAPVLLLVERAPGVAVETLGDPVRIELGPMPDDEVAALLDALVPLGASLRARLVELAGGNPDLAVRTLGALVERDALAVTDAGHVPRPGEVVELPDEVAEATGARVAAVLGDLPLAERTVIVAAALLGPALDPARFEALCVTGGTAPDEVLARAGGLLVAEPGALAFEHPAVATLIREVWADLPAAQLAVAALEDAAVPPAIRAPLLLRAGRLREAAEPLLAGALDALAAGDTARATEWLERRSAILDGLGRDPDGPEQVDDVLLRARIAVAVGAGDAGELARRAVALAERHGPPRALGEARIVLAKHLRERGEPDAARLELRGAIDAFDAAADPAGAARALRLGGDLARAAGDLDGAAALYRRALARLGERDHPQVRASLRAALGAVILARGQLDVAEEELAAALALAEAHEAVEVEAAILCALGDVARAREDLRTADARYRSALGRVPWHDARRVRTIQLRRALVLLAGGRYGEAGGALDALLSGADPADRGPFVAWCRLAQLAVAVRADEGTWQGHLQLATELLRSAELREADAAWLLEITARRAADLARPERAEPAWRLAAEVWRAIGRAADADRVERSLATLRRSAPR